MVNYLTGQRVTKLYERTIPYKLSNYNAGQQRAWQVAASERKRIEKCLRQHGYERKPFQRPVSVEIIRNLGPKQRFWDCDSILRGSAKQLIDSLVECGWFKDDSPEYIQQCVGRQTILVSDDGKRKLASTTICIWSNPSTFN